MGWEHCTARGGGAWRGRHRDEVHRELPDRLACSELEYHLQEKQDDITMSSDFNKYMVKNFFRGGGGGGGGYL